MSFELNKIFAAIFLSALIGMVVGNLVEIIYHPSPAAKRGYEVAITESTNDTSDTKAKEEPVDIKALMAQANAETGKELTKKCVSCHSFEKGGPHKIGPNLYAVYESKKASKEGYKYSDAMIGKGGAWTEEDLFGLLHRPKTFVPGTKMVFPGFEKPQDIANVVAFLKTNKD